MKPLFLLLCLFFAPLIFAQTDARDHIKVSVLTVGVADQSHSLYGHTAIRIKNDILGIDQVYNYGMFDFSTPNFIVRFVKGDMQYFAGAYPYADFEYNYKYENRSIYEQTLDLSTEDKLSLIQALETSITGEDKFYTYKFIQRNCTTKVVDVINEVLKKNVIYKHNVSETTYREILYPYAENQFFQKLGINLIFGAKTDEQATTLFLPFDLKNNLDQTTLNGKPLVAQNKTLFEANRIPNIIWWDSIYTLLFVLTLIVLVNKKTITNVYFIILGVLGIFFSLVGFYSFHEEIALNYNVLLMNPVLLFVVYFNWNNNKKAFLVSSYIALTCIATYTLFMLTKIHLEIVWPFIAANTALLVRGILVKKK
ncbi:DUF4105 domain-containing protein [Flavobacterium tegetincola]|uniref:lipoprotein N-acyltransferase Lnb domain-containing protein n=1 Tax=Flavobacterium tegetincola TaxID=150172 RepID=UPI0003FBC519|nr:DUF4105 domain-containing protein [Flavobacterium tegetincola]